MRAPWPRTMDGAAASIRLFLVRAYIGARAGGRSLLSPLRHARCSLARRHARCSRLGGHSRISSMAMIETPAPEIARSSSPGASSRRPAMTCFSQIYRPWRPPPCRLDAPPPLLRKTPVDTPLPRQRWCRYHCTCGQHMWFYAFQNKVSIMRLRRRKTLCCWLR